MGGDYDSGSFEEPPILTNSSSLAVHDPAASAPDALSVAPLAPPLVDEVRALVARLSPAERLWLSGYLAGLGAQPVAAAPAAQPAKPPVTVLFGSQSGNCEALAGRLVETLTARGVAATALDMLDCRKSHLQDAHTLLVIVSTHGEGDPPDRALPLHELLHSRKAPKLQHLRYSVLALGDSSYEKFCETGRQFDDRLRELGAQALADRVECDVDFEEPAGGWIDAVTGRLAEEAAASAEPRLVSVPRPTASLANAYTRKHPFFAPLLANQRLTGTGSTKDVRHLELALEDSGIRYEPGDALGIVPRNHDAEVAALLAVLRQPADAPVTVDGEDLPLGEALARRYDIGPVTTAFVRRYAEATGDKALAERLASGGDALASWLHGRHLVDLVGEYPAAGLSAAEFLSLLRPLAPRLYSIASSQRAVPDEVHLTISLVEYESLGRGRRGVVSGQVAELRGDDAALPVYLHRNPNFRLPADGAAPLIMIGPGTGVAPFRAFLSEREETGARGGNWLFFGDRRFDTDFLYQAEWLAWRASGLLTRIDVAFSRDQDRKVYVQDRIREHGAELWRWLDEGGHLYVCGDAAHMAPDVHQALLDVAQLHGGRSAEDAAAWLLELQRQRRYQRDVY